MLETGTIEMTPEAAIKLRELQAGDPKRALLRLYVLGKTCCSYQYGLAFDETPDEADTVKDIGGIRVAVDQVSAPYCDGAKIEWVDGPEGTGFLVRNSSLGGACSCNG
jgi:iron-sulfur cluster insertion protein